MKKWFERPVRMMRLDYIDQLSRMKDADLNELARSKREDWNVNCEWVIGTPGIALGLGHLTTFNTPKFQKYAPLGDWDLIREYLPYARKYGIAVIAYLNMHWFSYEFGAQHPDWEQVNAEGIQYGHLHPLYGSGTTFCVNSPWREWASEMISEAMKTGIDGVFLDGPVVFPECCYCSSCRAKFLKRYGENIPLVEDWADESWKDFVEFREDSMAEFLRDCREEVKAVNPDGVIFLNAGSWHAGAWRVARDIEKVGPFQDFNGAEAFFHPGPSAHILHFWATAAKHLMAADKPAVVFSHHTMGSWHYVPLPPMEAQLAIAQTTACGANPWIAVFDYALDNSRSLAMKPIHEIQTFLDKNEQYFLDSKSQADVALLFSRQSATFYISRWGAVFGQQGGGQERDLIADVSSGPQIEDLKKRKRVCDDLHGNSYLGYFTALTREHIPFDVVLDKDLAYERLKRFRVLILPNAACLSDAQIAAINEFAAAGGSVLAEFETGMYDERGNIRLGAGLNGLLGITNVSGAMSPAYGEEYIKVNRTHPVTQGFNDGQLIARMPFSLQVTLSASAASLAVFMNQIGQLYAPLGGESEYPALIVSDNPTGHSVYLSGLAGEFYGRYRMREYQALIANALHWLRRAPMDIEVKCPATIQVELRHQSKPSRALIHLVNNTGDMQRPVAEVIPVRDIHIQLRRKDVKRVRALWTGRELEFHQTNETCLFALPELGVYEVITVE